MKPEHQVATTPQAASDFGGTWMPDASAQEQATENMTSDRPAPGWFRSGRSPAETSAQTRTGGKNEFSGEVRNFESKQPMANGPLVWKFSIERYDPQTGGRLPQVGVEMRDMVDGFLVNGSQVTVRGRFNRQGLFLARKVFDRSMGTTFEPSAAVMALRAVFTVVFLVVFFGIVVLFFVGK